MQHQATCVGTNELLQSLVCARLSKTPFLPFEDWLHSVLWFSKHTVIQFVWFFPLWICDWAHIIFPALCSGTLCWWKEQRCVGLSVPKTYLLKNQLFCCLIKVWWLWVVFSHTPTVYFIASFRVCHPITNYHVADCYYLAAATTGFICTIFVCFFYFPLFVTFVKHT